MRYLFLFTIALLGFSAQAQNKQADSLWVDGICGMCENRIETALDTKGVWIADWDVNTKMLYVVYKPSKISKAEICAILNDVGHDTKDFKATDEQYSRVHDCCLYRDEKVKAEHQSGGDYHEGK